MSNNSLLIRIVYLIIILTTAVMIYLSSDLPENNTNLRFVTNKIVSTQVPISYLNDDYCDDGKDEPLTSACAGHDESRFICQIDGHSIPSSRFNDGVCDCCDGEDEKLSPFAIVCQNSCQRVHRNEEIELVFAIKQNGIGELKRILADISDPSSTNFGRHMNQKEIAEVTSCNSSSKYVKRYLESHSGSVVHVSNGGEYVRAVARVGVWETLLSTEFHDFAARDQSTDRRSSRLIRSLQYSLSEELRDHVHHVFNTVQFPVIRKLGEVSTMRNQRMVETASSPGLRSPIVSQIHGSAEADATPGITFFNGLTDGAYAVYYGSDPSYMPARSEYVPSDSFGAVVDVAPYTVTMMYFSVRNEYSNASICELQMPFGAISAILMRAHEGDEVSCWMLTKTSTFLPAIYIINMRRTQPEENYLFIDDTFQYIFNMSDSASITSFVAKLFGQHNTTLSLSGLSLALCSDFRQMNCSYFTVPAHPPLRDQHTLCVVVGETGTVARVLWTPTYAVTPATLNTFYNISSNVGHRNATQLIYASINQTFSPNDLAQFQRELGVPQSPVTSDYNGHSDDSLCIIDEGDCGEANLDVQVLTSLSQKPSPTTFYYYGVDDDWFVTWVTAVADMSSPAHVMSISYGADEIFIPVSSFEAFEREALKLSLQGVSIMVSSGDDGAFSSYARDSLDFCFYTSSFPATSEFVTAVGATMGPESGVVERACDSASGGRITSGGGFALRTQRPSWQDVAVHQYLRLHPFNGSNINAYNTDNGTVFFNEGGRGVPDISLLGFDYEVIIGGNHLGESGTSASAPAFAAMVSLVNAARFRAGKGPIGFLNQILYSLSANFTNDIILGDNSCVAQTDSTKLPNCCTLGGYSAAIGWDPVTGLGSVDFRRFLESLVSLDAVAAEEFPPSSSSDQTIRTLLIVVFTLALIGLGVVGLWLLVKRLRSHTYELFETDDEADVVVVR